MSKGALFWNSGRGKIGSIVLSNLKGQQITKAYQPNVTNPKTGLQTLQRIQMAQCVKFYKRAIANFFQFAFEDKTKIESYFNAFVSNNINRFFLLPKKLVLNQAMPAYGMNIILTKGSLGNFTSENNNGILLSFEDNNFQIEFTEAGELQNTVGAWSRLLIDSYGFLPGDILTLVYISSKVSYQNYKETTNQTPPEWSYLQFVLDSSSAVEIANVTSKKGNFKIDSFSARGVQITTNTSAESAAAAFIITRKVSGKLLCSTSKLYLSESAEDFIDVTATDAELTTVLKSWDMSSTAILEGGVEAVQEAFTEKINNPI